jgi:uncharacterized protein (DUF1330 family)
VKEDESMKANLNLVLAALVGVSIGAVCARGIHAHQVKVAPGYFIAEVEVADHAMAQKYGEKVPETLAPFNHHYVVRGGKAQSLEGELPKHIVIIAFDSAEKAREWYESPAYEAIKPLRLSAATSRIFFAEGIAPE